MQHLAGVAQHNSVLCKKCGHPFLATNAADSKGRGEREGQAWPFTLTLFTLWSAVMVFRDEELAVMDA